MILHNFPVGNDKPIFLIAGPCQIESLDHTRLMADKLVRITSSLGVNFVYKSSYDKANRSSVHSKRGVGIDEGLRILETIKAEFGIPVLTDVHEISEVKPVAEVVDVIQIPAFLCRQTSLLEEAAIQAKNYGRSVNVKKGQFLSPEEMKNVVEKFDHFGLSNLMLTERGTTFGYNRLVSDMSGLPTMAEFGRPVIYDATHSVQRPGGLGSSSGGNRQMVPPLARAAVAVGVAGLFMETHQDPDNAPSDGPNMIAIDELEAVLRPILDIDRIIKSSKRV